MDDKGCLISRVTIDIRVPCAWSDQECEKVAEVTQDIDWEGYAKEQLANAGVKGATVEVAH